MNSITRAARIPGTYIDDSIVITGLPPDDLSSLLALASCLLLAACLGSLLALRLAQLVDDEVRHPEFVVQLWILSQLLCTNGGLDDPL